MEAFSGTTGDLLNSLLDDTTNPSDHLNPPIKARSYSTENVVGGETISIQGMQISSAGGKYNDTESFIGNATTVEFKTTTRTGDESSGSASTGFGVDVDGVISSGASGEESATKTVETVEITIGPQHFDLLKLLGTGAFGKVVLVQGRIDRKLYAMKVISKKLLRKKNNVSYMKSERDILTKVHHPFLVSLQFAFQSDTKIFLVMDFLGGGELFLHLRRRGLIREHEVQFYLGEMILAVDFLHQKGIIHRDLKPENILLRADAHICITDFGLAKEIGDGLVARTLCGTSEYMAPEMLSRAGYGKAVDWWALGALCYEMLVGRAPFNAPNQKELDRKIMFEKLSVPSYLTATTHALLKAMLDKDPSKRLGCARSTMFSLGGVAALKQHDFFKGLNWTALGNLELSPPINLATETYDGSLPPSASGKGGRAGQTPPPTSSQQDDNAFTRFFSEEYTTQVLSPSLLEDTYSTHTASPMEMSRTGSPSQQDDFRDFDYMGAGAFRCTVDQLEEFNALLQQKALKEQKKKALRLKKEAKQAEEEALRRQRAEEEAKEKARQAAEEKMRKEQARLEKERQAQLAEERRISAEKERVRQAHNAKVEAFREEMNVVGKKIKNLRKKLRDITDLVERLAREKKALDKDQKQKVARQPELEEELKTLLEEEAVLAQRDPGELIPAPTEAEISAAATAVLATTAPATAVNTVTSDVPPPPLLTPTPSRSWGAVAGNGLTRDAPVASAPFVPTVSSASVATAPIDNGEVKKKPVVKKEVEKWATVPVKNKKK